MKGMKILRQEQTLSLYVKELKKEATDIAVEAIAKMSEPNKGQGADCEFSPLFLQG